MKKLIIAYLLIFGGIQVQAQSKDFSLVASDIEKVTQAEIVEFVNDETVRFQLKSYHDAYSVEKAINFMVDTYADVLYIEPWSYIAKDLIAAKVYALGNRYNMIYNTDTDILLVLENYTFNY